MWDNAPLLRTLANLLFGLSLVLILYAATRYVLHLSVFPLSSVQLRETPRHVPVDLIERVVKEQIKGNFFNVDLNQTRVAFEHLPWVRKVSVRRKFPWSLEVELEEHVALARWNGNGLVNTHGEVFLEKTEQALPVFAGQPNTSAQMTTMYDEFSKELQPLKQDVMQISLSPRFAWQVRLSNGMVIELGREQMQQRLERFVEVYPYSISTLPNKVMHVDLRYKNGFAAYLPDGVGMQDKRASGNKA
jgi:cell division protein FtsQ